MSSHSYEQLTSYGRPLGHSLKCHFAYKCTSYEQPTASKGHISCVARVAAHSRFHCTLHSGFLIIVMIAFKNIIAFKNQRFRWGHGENPDVEKRSFSGHIMHPKESLNFLIFLDQGPIPVKILKLRSF